MADKYLYDPNSPIRNEEFYIPVLECMVTSPLLDDTGKIRPRDRLALAQKNRPGTQALDFTYTLASGKQGTLHGLSADYTVFHQPPRLPCLCGNHCRYEKVDCFQSVVIRKQNEDTCTLYRYGTGRMAETPFRFSGYLAERIRQKTNYIKS